ncbi:2-hydroxyacid dehydrogenase [Piscinibacter sakaiensis]|uniref:D-3-phosphoglycerate dehydrogenase n=1 Tax=Piscinibacter sakaiensis TaxID=1547922 RepID=A0A0K8P6F3_PISS1|nr:glyoxylate/hydroxypyruvate reductase A [Piscinibacter sakaiensis]GAP38283.1 D-3-phosphoglycerate dehydrogenase [Piscinibacter sakaiensis]
MTVLLCGRFDPGEQEAWLAALGQACPDEVFVSDRADPRATAADVALVANPPPGALQGLPRLGFVQSLWAGVERLLADPTLPPAVPLARMVDPSMSAAMAQTVAWAVLALQRDFFRYARQQRAGQWLPGPQRRADDFPVGLLGLGEMGAAAARALTGLGFPVHGWSRTPRTLPGLRCHHGEAGLHALLGEVAVLVNLLPLTPQTRGLLAAPLFARARPGLHLVNLARGAHLVEADALAALAQGQLDELVLDVFAEEPLPPGHPFWLHPRVTVLPHVAAQTDPATAAAVAAANLRRWRSGQPVQHLVDRGRQY